MSWSLDSILYAIPGESRGPDGQLHLLIMGPGFRRGSQTVVLSLTSLRIKPGVTTKGMSAPQKAIAKTARSFMSSPAGASASAKIAPVPERA